jgi:hypothetical protein
MTGMLSTLTLATVQSAAASATQSTTTSAGQVETGVTSTATSSASTNTTTAIATSGDPVIPNQAVTYSAAASPATPGGTITFYANGKAIAACTNVAVSSIGQARCSQSYSATGNYLIYATYAPGQGHIGSTSPPLGETVDNCGTSLRGCNLRSANLRNALLYGANLRGANLQGANLQGTLLVGANLQGANLQGANLRGANLQGANLRGANLQGANLHGANLQGTLLVGANLRGANLRGANLQGANLQGANLQNGNFSGANLSNANLQGANLQGDTLTDATLLDATTKGANLHKVTWSNTTCPDNTNSNNDQGTCLNNLSISATPPDDLASQVAAIANSATANTAEQTLENAVADPSVGSATEELLLQYGPDLTAFQTDLLQVNQLLANPANQVLLSEMNAGDLLTSAQLASVTNLLTTIEDDPAVELLEQKGSELQKDPSELTSDIAALNDAPRRHPQLKTLPLTPQPRHSHKHWPPPQSVPLLPRCRGSFPNLALPSTSRRFRHWS